MGPKSYHCATPGCTSDDRKRGRYGYMSDVQFFPFPTKKKAPSERKKWLELLRREDFDPNRKARVCSLHFVDGQPTREHPYPELFQYNNFKDSTKVGKIVTLMQIMGPAGLYKILNSIATLKVASSQQRFYFDIHKVCGKLRCGKTALCGL